MLFFKKKHSLILISAIVMALLLCSCSNVTKKNYTVKNPGSSSQTEEAPVPKIYTIRSTVQWSVLSKSLSELYKSSEFVGEVKVENATPKVESDGRITTTFTIEVVDAVKGSYNGEEITTVGGVASYKDYINKAASGLDEKFPKGKNVPEKVKYSFGGIPTVEDGDSLIVFLKTRDGKLGVTNSCEGIFKIEGAKLTNDSLKGTLLLNNILAQTNSTAESGIAKDVFIQKLQAIEKAQ